MSTIDQNQQGGYRRVMTVAGSDSGGGAGIQADLKTFAALGCYGMSVITALTAQNTVEVRDIHPVPAAFVRSQMEAVMDDLEPDAVKIGMLFSPEIINTVASVLRERAMRRVVLDPVMVAQSGGRLLEDRSVQALQTELMPLAALITPNLPEAEVLLQRTIRSLDDMRPAARDLAEMAGTSILLKGGHLEHERSTDILYVREEDLFVTLHADLVQTENTHGTGCTLSSAVAAGLAKGMDVETAVRKAKDFLGRALRAGAGYRLGKGNGPVHHFFAFWKEK